MEPGPGGPAEGISHADAHQAAAAAEAAAAGLLHGSSGSSEDVRAPAAVVGSGLQHGQEDEVPRREVTGLLLGLVLQDRGQPGCAGRQNEEAIAGGYLLRAGWAPGTPV